jgi:hypothetical protein
MPTDKPIPEVHFGSLTSEIDWRKFVVELDLIDDDEGPETTPEEVVKLLGFDPKNETF